ncbi:hypothetical protein ZIOFF_067811 [Zingiber officinale]|uniref:Major facilitator superfamily (MFS) profile domain-containing protein n=1 Tax=Zingiber officinale TaxID=94328 RepID=A0A8J5BKM9_ZINOF|nr:hypothetical protein ZIOFF_067811 [Zingiber officinale]
MEVKEEGETGKPLMERKREKASASPSIWMVVASTAVAVSGSFEFGMSVGYSSPSQSGIMHDLNLSLPQYSLFGSILTIGAMIGAIFSGRVADLIGRKSAMAVSDFLCITGWTFIFLTKGIWLLDIGRLLIGCGIGLLSYVVPVYIAEITPKSLRGGFAAVNQVMEEANDMLWRVTSLPVGNCFHLAYSGNYRYISMFSAVNESLLYSRISAMAGYSRLQAVIEVWVGALGAMVGSHQEFVAVLKRLRGKHSDVSQEAEEIMEFTVSLQRLPQSSIVDLFQKIYLHAVIVGVGLMILQQFGGVNAIHFYASEIFVSAVQVSAAGTCVGCFLVAIVFLLKDHDFPKDLTTALALGGILIYTGSFSLGMGAIPWVIMSEIFPLNMKGTAGSLVTFVSWAGSWVISFGFNFLMMWNSAGTFFIFSSICGLTIVFVERLVPETKGRTLEEIQASMSFISSD